MDVAHSTGIRSHVTVVALKLFDDMERKTDQKPPISANLGAFAQRYDDPRHIVDVLIEERASGLMRHRLVWPIVKSLLYPMLKYDAAVQMADEFQDLIGTEIFDRLGERLRLNLTVHGLEHLPRAGGALVVANHPTGIADGIAVKEALRPARGDLSFLANRDALRVAPGLIDTLIPVEWVEEKRKHAKTKDMLRLTRAAIEQGRLVGVFPAGRLAVLRSRGLEEQPWLSSTISFMRRFDVPIVPLHISSRNSLSYYALSLLHKELKDITLFNELLNKTGASYEMTIGRPIMPDQLSGSAQEAIDGLRSYVEIDLKEGQEFVSSPS